MFFPVKSLPTPEFTGFARLRRSRKRPLERITRRIPRGPKCDNAARNPGCEALRQATSGFETILQKTEALENDSGSQSKVTSAKRGHDRSAGRRMQAFMYVLETRVWI
ncbi:hypothetical protein ACQPTN_38355 [Bradyrhizobium sp. 13971]